MYIGDHSAATNLTVDRRMHLFIDMEDPDVIPDLRHLSNSSASATKYELFWNACDSFLNEETAKDVMILSHTWLVLYRPL